MTSLGLILNVNKPRENCRMSLEGTQRAICRAAHPCGQLRWLQMGLHFPHRVFLLPLHGLEKEGSGEVAALPPSSPPHFLCYCAHLFLFQVGE